MEYPNDQKIEKDKKEYDLGYVLHRDRIGRQKGNGVNTEQEEVHDHTAHIPNDGRSKTRTTFNPKESNNRQKWEKLAKINDGMLDKDRKQNNRKANQQRDIELFSSQLNLKKNQVESVKYHFKKIDINKGGWKHEAIILALITLIVNKDQRRIRSEKQYNTLRKSLNITRKTIRNIRRKYRKLVT